MGPSVETCKLAERASRKAVTVFAVTEKEIELSFIQSIRRCLGGCEDDLQFVPGAGDGNISGIRFNALVGFGKVPLDKEMGFAVIGDGASEGFEIPFAPQ